MKKKRYLKRILPVFLMFTMMFSYMPVGATENDVETKKNLALGKTATASGHEPGTNFTADKAIDGITDRLFLENGDMNLDRAGQSRWASPLNAENPWITIDLGKSEKFDEIVIEWERRNINFYKIEVSDDNSNWKEVYTSTEKNKFSETLNIGSQEGRYVKLTVTDYEPTQEGSNISWNNFSIYEMEIYNNSGEEVTPPEYVIPEEGVNVSLGKTATASSQETNTFTADKAIDGIVDRKPEGTAASRWASAISSEAQWLNVDLGERTQFDRVVVEWERKNATEYKVQVSDDNETWVDVATRTTAPTINREIIVLTEKVVGKYVRLYIDTHVADSDGVKWNNVSVFEMEIYNGDIPTPPQTPQEIANAITIPELTIEDTVLTMPTVPEGYEVSFVGANYEEVIGADMSIYRPLVDTTVLVNFEVTQGDKVAYTPDIEVLVPGENQPTGNTVPAVIPELREWLGGTGDFTITDNSRIVIATSSEAALTTSMNTFAEDYKDIVGKEIEVVVSDDPQAGDLYFELNENHPELRSEGYYMEIGDFVNVEANEAPAAFLSTRTILQILKQNGTTIPKGTTRDYPLSDIRGFMLDVGRKPITLDFLYDVVKLMSWYKMNDFQVHLSDNYIWVPEYGAEAIEKAYSGFRLESNDIGENGVKLTSTDLFYTKSEFSKFIDDAKAYSVNIVPEIESPAHALSFMKVHPEYAYGTGDNKGVGQNAAMLDVTNPEVVDYIKGIFSEYTDGENPVFRDTKVHIGADEFYGNSEEYRAYTDDMLKYIRDEKGRTPRVWGSLTQKKGTTPVTSEGVEMNIWNNGWADPSDMLNAGYDLINTEDGKLYIVPDAGYYYNYLNINNLYNNYEVNKFGNGDNIPAGSPQMKGGMFAVWNDMIDRKANGIVELDIYDRILPAVQVLSEKMWGKAESKTFAEFQEVAASLGDAPNTNPRYKVKAESAEVLNYDFERAVNGIVPDKSGNGYDSVGLNNATVSNGILKLNGESSYLESSVGNIGPKYSVSFIVKRDESSGNEEQVLFESEKGEFKAVQKETGKVGFSREFYDYSFDYELPKGEWVEITIVGRMAKTELYVNGEYMDEVSKSSTTGDNGTFIFPLEKVGSMDNAFKGEIKSLTVSTNTLVSDETLIPQEQMTAIASSEHPNVGSEGLASFAIDGDPGTIWHTNYSTPVQLPQHITLDLGGTYTVEKFTYLPRANGGNGTITEYELQVSTNGSDFTTVSEGAWASDGSLKTVKFDPVENVTHVRLIAKAGNGGFASAAELNVHKLKETTPEPTVEVGFKVTEPEKEVKVGSDFNIKVGTKGLEFTNMYAMKFDFVYDAEKVEFVEGTSLDDSKYIVSTKDDNGIVKVVIATKGVAIENDKDIVNLEFKAKATGENVEFNITSGTIADDNSNITEMIDEKVSVDIVEDIVNPNPEVDKTSLKIVIDYADEIVTNGGLEGIVPAVVKEFNEALAEAKEVYKNIDATETDVDNSFKRLVNVIWMLEYKQGNKEALEALVDAATALVEKEYTPESWAKLQEVIKIAEKVLADENAMQDEIDEVLESLNYAMTGLIKKNVDKTALQNFVSKVEGLKKDEYIESTWSKFEEALNLAKDVLADEDVTQDEVDSAYNTLVKSYIELRLKPDKSKLEELINKVKDMDLSKYTDESVSELNKELEKAISVFNNKNATQEDINMATRGLNSAVANLTEKTEDNDSGNNKPENNNSNDNNDNGNNNSGNGGTSNSSKPSIKLPSTGAAVSSSLILLLGAVTTFAGVTTLKKKKRK